MNVFVCVFSQKCDMLRKRILHLYFHGIAIPGAHPSVTIANRNQKLVRIGFDAANDLPGWLPSP